MIKALGTVLKLFQENHDSVQMYKVDRKMVIRMVIWIQFKRQPKRVSHETFSGDISQVGFGRLNRVFVSIFSLEGILRRVNLNQK